MLKQTGVTAVYSIYYANNSRGLVTIRQRVITAIVALAVFVPILIFPYTFVFDCVIAILSAIAAYEMLRCIGEIKNYVISAPAVVYAFLAPLLARTRFINAYGVMLSATIVFMLYLFFSSVVFSDKVKTQSVSLVFTTIFYIAVSFTSIVKIRNVPEIGSYIYLLIFIGAWVTDTFAYFTGMFFGKHKLIPKISPKKTIEGAIGGVVFCSVAYVLYGFILSRYHGYRPHYLLFAFIGIGVSIVAQFGDLLASAIKRNFNVKDYGNLFPGHGGVLDRFDSILAVAPVLFMLTGNPDIITIFK